MPALRRNTRPLLDSYRPQYLKSLTSQRNRGHSDSVREFDTSQYEATVLKTNSTANFPVPVALAEPNPENLIKSEKVENDRERMSKSFEPYRVEPERSRHWLQTSKNGLQPPLDRPQPGRAKNSFNMVRGSGPQLTKFTDANSSICDQKHRDTKRTLGQPSHPFRSRFHGEKTAGPSRTVTPFTPRTFYGLPRNVDNGSTNVVEPYTTAAEPVSRNAGNDQVKTKTDRKRRLISPINMRRTQKGKLNNQTPACPKSQSAVDQAMSDSAQSRNTHQDTRACDARTDNSLGLPPSIIRGSRAMLVSSPPHLDPHPSLMETPVRSPDRPQIESARHPKATAQTVTQPAEMAGNAVLARAIGTPNIQPTYIDAASRALRQSCSQAIAEERKKFLAFEDENEKMRGVLRCFGFMDLVIEEMLADLEVMSPEEVIKKAMTETQASQ